MIQHVMKHLAATAASENCVCVYYILFSPAPALFCVLLFGRIKGKMSQKSRECMETNLYLPCTQYVSTSYFTLLHC